MPQYVAIGTIKELIVHHTDSDRDTTTFEQIRQWHLQKGWVDIGYHFVFTADGKQHVGRPQTVMGSQALHHNSNALGLCVTGNFEKQHPTDEQIHSLIQTLAVLCRKYKLKPSAIKGHRDVNQTTCPGKNLYSKLPYIRQKVAEYL